MKKVLTIWLTLMMCLSLSVCAFAEEAKDNETVSVSTEALENALKVDDDAETTKSSSSGPSVGDLIHFVPTEIEVSDSKVFVEGYFINLNTSVSVMSFKEFEMSVYLEGNLLVSGNFGRINDFTIDPLGAKYQTFTFNGKHNLNNGKYVCDDRTYCVLACSFTSASR